MSTTSTKRVLDLFCCEGGAASGYADAGYVVYGMDLDAKFQKRYPFFFLAGDALAALQTLVSGEALTFIRPDGLEETLVLDDFSLIHASPPCQGYTRGNAGRDTNWPKLIPEVRELLVQTEKPYIIENVKDAASEMVDPILLCGCMFDLSTTDTDGVQIHLQRARMFESNMNIEPPRACDHSSHEWVAGAYGGARRDKYEAKYVRKGGYVPKDKEVVKKLLGVQHDMTWNGLFECIPPAYTKYLGGEMDV